MNTEIIKKEINERCKSLIQYLNELENQDIKVNVHISTIYEHSDKELKPSIELSI